jgi:hypothetical protein
MSTWYRRRWCSPCACAACSAALSWRMHQLNALQCSGLINPVALYSRVFLWFLMRCLLSIPVSARPVSVGHVTSHMCGCSWCYTMQSGLFVLVSVYSQLVRSVRVQCVLVCVGRFVLCSTQYPLVPAVCLGLFVLFLCAARVEALKAHHGMECMGWLHEVCCSGAHKASALR